MLGTKLSWRGARARVLRLSETSLSTHDPADGRPTNTWRLAEVVSAEVHGLVLQLRFSGACALCGLIVPTLSFSLPDAESAAFLLSRFWEPGAPGEQPSGAAAPSAGGGGAE